MSDTATLIAQLEHAALIGGFERTLLRDAAARIAELEEALKPFADAADQYHPDAADDAVRIHCIKVTLTLGDLRRAAAVRARPAP